MKFFRKFFKTAKSLLQANGIVFSPLFKRLPHYTVQRSLDDLRSATNLAMMAFPQGMAYALIAGLPIQYGLYAFIGASLVGPFLSSSRFSSYGPSNATAVLILSTFLALNMSPSEMLISVPILGLLAGLYLIIGAFANVARLIQYISRTVITGYITAAALLIIVNQIKNVLGLDIPKSSSFFAVLYHNITHITATHWPALLLAVLSTGTYIFFQRKFKKLPGVALTILLMGGLAAGMNAQQWNVATLDSIRLDEWRFAMIALDPHRISGLATAALALAFLITLESTSIGKSLASRAGDRLNANQEMLGLGAANIGSALVGGMPSSSSLTRSSLNYRSGAWSGLSNVYAAIIVLVLLVALSPLIRFIPVPTLAVVVIAIGISLFNKHQILIVSRATKSDAITFFVTLSAGVFLALDTAIYLGSATAILLFLRKVAEPELVEYTFSDEGVLCELDQGQTRPDPEISIVHVEGELFFGASEVFYNQTRRVCEDPNLKVLILKLRNAHRLDASAVLALEELLQFMREKERYLIICEARKDTIRIFKNSGLLEAIGRDNIFTDNTTNLTASAAAAIRRAKTLLQGQEAKVSIYVGTEKHEQ